MRKLYEINADIEKLLDEHATIAMGENGVDTETGEVFNLAERLNALTVEKNEKIKSVVVYLDDLNGKLESIREKLKSYNKIRESLENEIEGLSNYLVFATDKKGFEDNDIMLRIKETKCCDIVDETKIPPEYFVSVVERKVSKSAINKAFKAGEEVPGAEWKTNYKIKIV